MIRPEDIRLEMSDEKEATDKRLVQDRSGDNRLSGRVLSSAFLGDRTRVWVDIAADHDPVCVDCFARQRYAEQQPVSVVIDPQRMVWLKEEQRC
ncbi:TOBE domain-containing protein [Vibrio sp. PP-XX7]